jgi:hypothetical protein
MPDETSAETQLSLTLTALTTPVTCTAIYFPAVYSSHSLTMTTTEQQQKKNHYNKVIAFLPYTMDS